MGSLVVRQRGADSVAVDCAPPQAPPDRRRDRELVYLAGVAAATFAVRLPALHQPLDRDMAGYGTVGWRLLHGDVPYRDLFEQKQPLAYPVYGFLHLLSDHHTEVLRVAAIAAATATAFLLYFLLRATVGRLVAVAASALYVVPAASSYVEGFDLNTEHILVPLTAAAILLSFRSRTSTWPWMPVLVGVLAGVTVLAKVVGVFVAPAVLLPLVAAAPTTRERIRRVLAFGGGAAAPIAAVCGLFAVLGALDDMIDTTVRFNLLYNTGEFRNSDLPSLPERLLAFGDTWPGVLLAVALVVGAVQLVTHKPTRLLTATALAWGVGAWVGATYGVNRFPHYYAPVVPPAVVLLTLPLATTLRRPLHTWGVRGALVAVAATLASPFAADVASFTGLTPVEVAVKVYGDQAYVWNDYEPVGKLVRDVAPPGARAMVWGAESGFYWFSGVPPATRYFFDYPLWIEPRRAVEQQRFLCRRPPELVVLPDNYEWSGYDWAPDIALRAEDYELVVAYNSTRVFRLAGDGRQPWCDALE